MPRETLIDFFSSFSSHEREFLIYEDGYRTHRLRYREVAEAAGMFCARLEHAGLTRGDRVVIWSENRPEWVIALWGCLLGGIVVVPVDYRTSAALLERIRAKAEARLVLIGDDTPELAPAGDYTVWRLTSPAPAPAPRANARISLSREDIAEILFTSGATAEPKGVVITHRNVLANLIPVEQEVLKYRRWARPFAPIRFVNLLPLSHMFGQAMATFIPPILPGVTIFLHSYSPAEIVKQVRHHRASVLVCVPKMLEVLRAHAIRLVPAAAQPPAAGSHWLQRWWQYRQVHRLFGWKFWSIIVGAAPLDPELEEFWRRMGYVVVQGYGLTETAPIVSLNHPFHTRKGSVGKPIAGVELKISPDGEILVRGDNVTSGYWKAAAATAEAFEDGWFRTGDIGKVDEAGRLSVLGRKKEMIVTPEGLNVFPEDVERILNEASGVHDSAVVGVTENGRERVHAVLILNPAETLPEAVAESVIRSVNTQLEDHQKVRGFSIWPDRDLPRTEGTRKLKRAELKQWVAGGRPVSSAASGPSVEQLVARFTGGRVISARTTLDELGLSSLERVELMMALEQQFQITIDEAAFTGATPISELEQLVISPAPLAAQRGARSAIEPVEPVLFPAWNRSTPARIIRRASLPSWILPLAQIFLRVKPSGLEHLDRLEPPVIFAPNHQSHFDVPAILSAMPAKWRYRAAPAMSKEFFQAHFFPDRHSGFEWFTNSLNYYLSTLFFNAFPFPQREAGALQTLRYMGELVSEGNCILIFPEGRITTDGEIQPFNPGVGMMASRLRVPIVPIRLVGVDKVLHRSWRWPRRGRVEIRFGPPIHPSGDDYAALALEVEAAVRRL